MLFRSLPFLADTLSFVISVSALIGMKTRQAAGLATTIRAKVRYPALSKDAGQANRANANSFRLLFGENLWNDIRAGVRWLHHDKFTRVTVALSAGTTLICQALIMIFLAYAHSQHTSSLMIGIVLAASGLGGAFGSLIASRLPAPTRRSWTLIRRCAWIAAVPVLIVSRGLPFWIMAFVMAILGFTGALGNVELGTYLIQNAPEDMLARVTSIGRLMSFGACSIGPILGGVAVQEYKIRGAVLLLSVAISAMWLFSLLLPSGRAQENRKRKVRLSLTQGKGGLGDAASRSCEILGGCVALGCLAIAEVRREKWGAWRPDALEEFSRNACTGTVGGLSMAFSTETAADSPVLMP